MPPATWLRRLWLLLLSLPSSVEGLVPHAVKRSPPVETKAGEILFWSSRKKPTRSLGLKSTRAEPDDNRDQQQEAAETEPLSLMSFLQSMNETVYDVSDNSIRTFNMDLYNLAMDDPFAAKDVVAYLHESSLGKLSPNPASFGIVLEGFIQHNELQTAEEFLFCDERNDTLPSLHECMRLMNAYKDAKDRTDGAERAENILRRYKGEENKAKLKCVAVEAWCQSVIHGDFGLQRAEALLEEMEQENASDTSRLYAYTSYMVGLSKSSIRKKATIAQDIFDKKIVEPDIVAVTALLNCWAKTRDYGERAIAGDRAIAILDELEAHKYLKANVVTYSTAIAAIGNSLDPSKAEEIILVRMPRNGIEVDTKTYNAWLLYGIRDAKRAIEILESMPVEPDVQTWGAVLRTCDPVRAQALLGKMERLYKSGKSKVRPNYVCYTTVRFHKRITNITQTFNVQVMNAWKRSNAPGALEKIESILKKMEDSFAKTRALDTRPNSLSYATVCLV